MSENQSVVGAICSLYDTYFEAEKKIADCIIQRKEEVIDMTVAELARASDTSDATVSRFCRRCGFKGFHHLKMSLAKDVTEEHSKAIPVSNDIMRDDLAQSLQNILANKVAELTQTVSMVNPEELEEILKLLEHARMVQVVAVGNISPVAMDFAFKLNQLGIAAVYGAIWESQLAYSRNLDKEDVVVVITSSGTSRRLLTLIREAQTHGCKIIGISNKEDSPVAQASDYHIVMATREKLLLGEFCFSRVVATAVVETLYLLLAADKMDSDQLIEQHRSLLAAGEIDD